LDVLTHSTRFVSDDRFVRCFGASTRAEVKGPAVHRAGDLTHGAVALREGSAFVRARIINSEPFAVVEEYREGSSTHSDLQALVGNYFRELSYGDKVRSVHTSGTGGMVAFFFQGWSGNLGGGGIFGFAICNSGSPA